MKYGYLYLNENGNYLYFEQVSSHGSGVVYSYTWVSDINMASIISNTAIFTRLHWKYGSPEDEIITMVKATETRTVKLIKEED